MLDQIENKRGSPDLHGRGPFAHIRVAEDDVKPAITASVNVRFVPRVDQWPAIHRVNAHQHAEKICPLRDLISPRLTRRTLRFVGHPAIRQHGDHPVLRIGDEVADRFAFRPQMIANRDARTPPLQVPLDLDLREQESLTVSMMEAKIWNIVPTD